MPDTPEPTWHDKFHPAFFEVAPIVRTFEQRIRQIRQAFDRAMKSRTADRQALARERAETELELSRWVDAKMVDVNSRYPMLPHNPRAYNYLDPVPGEPSDDRLFKLVHWWRHREPLHAAIAGEVEGHFGAFKKIARTQEDVWRVVRHQGPLKPFQGDMVHREFLELVFCFETTRLTSDELAECADRHCGCGKSHDADALKKQYARLKRDLHA